MSLYGAHRAEMKPLLLAEGRTSIEWDKLRQEVREAGESAEGLGNVNNRLAAVIALATLAATLVAWLQFARLK